MKSSNTAMSYKKKSYKYYIFFAFILLCPRCFAQSSSLEKVDNPFFPIYTLKLSNGLEVYFCPDSLSPSIEAEFLFRVGGRDEIQGVSGMAHYLEHMLFKGTQEIGTTNYSLEKQAIDSFSLVLEQLHISNNKTNQLSIYEQVVESYKNTTKYAIPNQIDFVYDQIGINYYNAFTTKKSTYFTYSFPQESLAN